MLQKTKAGFYIFKRLSLVPGLIHGFSTIAFGNMSETHDRLKKALTNQSRFAQAAGFKQKEIFTVEQKHSQRIVTLRNDTPLDQNSRIEADGMITNQRGIGLLIKTADCLPLIFVAPDKKAIGLIHAGRAGVKLGIHQEALTRIKAAFGADLAKLLIAFGPAICGRCYHAKIDLAKIVQADLLKMGVKKENIELAKVCTLENPDFYSHQQSVATGQPEGRFATVLAWKN